MVEIKIPDFDDLMRVVNAISSLSLEKAKLDVELKTAEANIYLEANTNSKYFQNGKSPSVSFVEKTWAYAGFSGELLQLREKLAIFSAKLESCKLEYDAMKMAIEIWRTSSANERSATL